MKFVQLAIACVFLVNSAFAQQANGAAGTLAASESVRVVVPFAELARAPSVTLYNGEVSVKIYLPDARRGFYRGIRFDRAGVFGSLTYRGHDFYKPWFHAMSTSVRDYVLENETVVVAPNTAAIGPVEEFNGDGGALGYSDAVPGGTFVKIGVGVLGRIDDTAYDRFRQYPLVNAGERINTVSAERADFMHLVDDPTSGYGYKYTKTIRLEEDQPVMLIEHVLHNTGNKLIDTTVYNHNFLNIDGIGTTQDLQMQTPFELQVERAPDPALAEIVGNRFTYLGTPNNEQRVSARLAGFGATADDYDFHIMNRKLGTGVRIKGDRPLTRVALWSIPPVMSIEPFISMSIQPGQRFTWSYRYEFEAEN